MRQQSKCIDCGVSILTGGGKCVNCGADLCPHCLATARGKTSGRGRNCCARTGSTAGPTQTATGKYGGGQKRAV